MKTTCWIGVGCPGAGGSGKYFVAASPHSSDGPSAEGRRLLASTCVAPAASVASSGGVTSDTVPATRSLSPPRPGETPSPLALATAMPPAAATTDVGYQPVGTRPRCC